VKGRAYPGLSIFGLCSPSQLSLVVSVVADTPRNFGNKLVAVTEPSAVAPDAGVNFGNNQTDLGVH